MKKIILINEKNKKIFYFSERKSKRAKNIFLKLKSENQIEVVLPMKVFFKILNFSAEKFILQNQNEILKWSEKIKISTKKLAVENWKENLPDYYKILFSRIEYFNQFYNFSYQKVSIKDLKSRWGSCSALGNLNFNYRIFLLPAKIRDYVIVHELCHLGELNHSSKFWSLIERQMPDYKKIRKELKEYRF